MYKSMISALVLVFALAGAQAWAHPEDRVAFEPEFGATISAGKQTLRFQMLDLKTKKVLTDKDISITHEKKVHLFIFDRGLKEYHHEHPAFVVSPTFANGLWEVEVDLRADGRYWMWGQGQLASDNSEFTADTDFTVRGGAAANPLPTELGDVRSGSDGISTITLSRGILQAKEMAMLTIKFSRTDGTLPEITPYLGAMAHFVATNLAGDQLMHVHPMDHGGHFMIHTEFPKAGDYRIWAQFMDAGVLRTVPLSVKVQP